MRPPTLRYALRCHDRQAALKLLAVDTTTRICDFADVSIRFESLLAQAALPLVSWGLFTLAVLWLGSVGACIGSFLNVLVYRLPRRMSIVHPPSRCPSCQHAIRWYDNLPILGWVALRGKCRDCQTCISSRYPLVELCAAALGVLTASHFLAQATTSHAVSSMLHWNSRTMQMVVTYAVHLLVIYTLLTAALIRLDGERVPRWLYAPSAFAGLVASLFSTQIPWNTLHSQMRASFVDGAIGLGVGILLGWLSAPPQRSAPQHHTAQTRDAELGICGLILGWQIVVLVAIAVTLATSLCQNLPCRFTRCRQISWSMHLVWATSICLITGPHLAAPAVTTSHFAASNEAGIETLDLFPQMSDKGALGWLLLGSLTVMLLARTTRRTSPAVTVEGSTSMHNPQANLEAILNSENYRLAERDTDFLARPELRPVRMQLELLKPEMAFEENDIQSTIVAFGGTQIVDHAEATARLENAQRQLETDPSNAQYQRALQRAERILAKAPFYEHAREFAQIVSAAAQRDNRCDYVIVTGGGPGVMEAANRGANEAGAKSIGLNITLPEEQNPNPYITPDLCFQFHYFALRKMHFLLRARALVVFPGGFGTLDELFDALTLRQVGRMQTIPIILFGREYWERVIDFQFLADEGVIRDEHLNLFEYVESPQEAWNKIQSFHQQATPAEPEEP
ncbi:MAG: hypothetical protein CMJ75_12915 [Planctomycetaceae bacterium]|nr:hypothetical protein [Planctomycetaceae bacterium]